MPLHVILFSFSESIRTEVLFSYALQISEEEITFLTGGDDPYDDDVVLNKLFHPNLKLLIVTEGSEGCRYYTKVSFPKSFYSDFNCLNRFYNPSFHYFLCSSLFWLCLVECKFTHWTLNDE